MDLGRPSRFLVAAACLFPWLACGPESGPGPGAENGASGSGTAASAVTVGTGASGTTSAQGSGGAGVAGATGPGTGGGNRDADGATDVGAAGGGLSSPDAATEGIVPAADASTGARTAPTGPFACTSLIGLFSTGEWWDAGFYDGLGADLKPKWQGRFTHYGYTYEYAKPDSYAWSPVNVGGTNNVRLTAPCAQGGASPDRVVYQAWTWELTTEAAWIESLEAVLVTIRAKVPSAKRIDLMTIIRCPMNLWCRADKPPLGPNTDHDATKQDCHVPEYVDSAFAKVAAAHPDLVTVVRPFEAHACAQVVDGIHLHEQTGPVAADIAAYFKTMP